MRKDVQSMKAGTASYGYAPGGKVISSRVSTIRKSTIARLSMSPNRSNNEDIRNSISDATLGKMREMRKSIAI